MPSSNARSRRRSIRVRAWSPPAVDAAAGLDDYGTADRSDGGWTHQGYFWASLKADSASVSPTGKQLTSEQVYTVEMESFDNFGLDWRFEMIDEGGYLYPVFVVYDYNRTMFVTCRLSRRT